MGNRLIYGNYVEGYDLTDIFNSPLELTYTTELENNSIGETSLTTSFASFGFPSPEDTPFLFRKKGVCLQWDPCSPFREKNKLFAVGFLLPVSVLIIQNK